MKMAMEHVLDNDIRSILGHAEMAILLGIETGKLDFKDEKEKGLAITNEQVKRLTKYILEIIESKS